MSFSSPVWNSKTNSYNITFIVQGYFTELYNYSSDDTVFPVEPDIKSIDFKNTVNDIIDTIVQESSSWFASPVSKTTFTKRLEHTFTKKESTYNYGHYILKWITRQLEISSNKFILHWDLESITPYTDNKDVEYSNDLESEMPVIIQTASPIVEVSEVEVPYNNKTEDLEISSRAILKKRIRATDLKIITLKTDLISAKLRAEKLYGKYLRRYGSFKDYDSDSEISTGSESEDS